MKHQKLQYNSYISSFMIAYKIQHYIWNGRNHESASSFHQWTIFAEQERENFYYKFMRQTCTGNFEDNLSGARCPVVVLETWHRFPKTLERSKFFEWLTSTNFLWLMGVWLIGVAYRSDAQEYNFVFTDYQTNINHLFFSFTPRFLLILPCMDRLARFDRNLVITPWIIPGYIGHQWKE